MEEEKELILKKLRPQYKKYWEVSLFKEKGFQRQKCPKCKKFFWALEKKKTCGDADCQGGYTFIGDSPCGKKFTYEETWKAIKDFFVKNGHTPFKSYPVVTRWFPGLYFTVAGIVAFQRKTRGKTVFEFPANPLIIPQFCLRFPDIENVGVTGRHMTNFAMVGQHSLHDPKKKTGYWKDKCIELDYKLLTEVFKIKPKEITFVEDAWMGAGAFGYSLEYFVRGLEVGNAVFTDFIGTPKDYEVSEEKVIDMGAGLERFTWLSQGTTTAYEAVYPEIEKYKKKAKNEKELEAIYAIFDHVRGLLLAVNDNALPSNVGGGYNLRVILRRSLNFLDQYKLELDLVEIAKLHAKQLNKTGMIGQDLANAIPQFEKILLMEKAKYEETKKKSAALIAKIVQERKVPSTDELLTLYESQGIHPEILQQEAAKANLRIDVPKDFYQQLMKKKERPEQKKEKIFKLGKTKETEILYYSRPLILEFDAKVIKIFDEGKVVALDKTAFYPESGGQENDFGTIDGIKVLNVERHDGVILHFLEQPLKKKGKIHGIIDSKRRLQLSQHHTGTHVVNYAARKVLGDQVFQAGAHKAENSSRLDITHWANLTKEEISQIEAEANKLIRQKTPVKKEVLPRMEAEQKYGFSIYQGGVVPEENLRIINIGGLDIEACGGTHLDNTSEIELIKIINSERIADGVTRINFAAGEAAKAIERKKLKILEDSAAAINVSKEELPSAAMDLFIKWKKAKKLLSKAKEGKLIAPEEMKELELSYEPVKTKVSDEDLLNQTLKVLSTNPEYLAQTLQRFYKEYNEAKDQLKKIR